MFVEKDIRIQSTCLFIMHLIGISVDTGHTVNTLNYLMNAQPLLLILKIRVKQGAAGTH